MNPGLRGCCRPAVDKRQSAAVMRQLWMFQIYPLTSETYYCINKHLYIYINGLVDLCSTPAQTNWQILKLEFAFGFT
jgi:hypothetical protein